MLITTLNKLLCHGSNLVLKESIIRGGRGAFIQQDCQKGDVIVRNFLPLVYTTHKRQSSSKSKVKLACHLCCDTKHSSCSICNHDPEGTFAEVKQIAEKINATHVPNFKSISSKANNASTLSSNTMTPVYDKLIQHLTLKVIEERKRSFENTLFTLFSLSSPDTSHMIQTEGDLIRLKAKHLIDISRATCNDDAAVDACISSISMINSSNTTTLTSNSIDDLAVRWYAHMWGVLSLNAIGTPIGTALYGMLSFINHSCKPNAGLRFDKTSLRVDVIALHDLKEGDEASINYVEGNSLLHSFDERQRYLEFNYGFKCSPQSCTCGQFPDA